MEIYTKIYFRDNQYNTKSDMIIIRQKQFSGPVDSCVVEDILRIENGLFRDKTTLVTTTLPRGVTFKVGDKIKLSESGGSIKITGIDRNPIFKNSIGLRLGSTPISQIKRGDKIIKVKG